MLTDGCTNKRKTGSLYCAMPGSGAIKMKLRHFHKVYPAKFALLRTSVLAVDNSSSNVETRSRATRNLSRT